MFPDVHMTESRMLAIIQQQEDRFEQFNSLCDFSWPVRKKVLVSAS